jgi:hypothetical protein
VKLMPKPKKFIQKAKLKKGALSRQLDIPEKENIPITLLRKITKAKTGRVVRNPTKSGKRRIKATRLVKKRANLAITLKELKRRKK